MIGDSNADDRLSNMTIGLLNAGGDDDLISNLTIAILELLEIPKSQKAICQMQILRTSWIFMRIA